MHKRASPLGLLSLSLLALANPSHAQQSAPQSAAPAASTATASPQSAIDAELKKLASRWRAARREYDRALKRGEDAAKLVDPTAEYAAAARALALKAKDDPAAPDVWLFALDLVKGDASGTLFQECLAASRAGAIEPRLAGRLAEEWRYALGTDVAEARIGALSERAVEPAVGHALRFALATSLLRAAVPANTKPPQFGSAAEESTPERIARARKLLEQVRTQAQGDPLAKRADDLLFAYEHLAVGTPAEDFEAVDENGKSWKLSDYRGKVVVVDFWGFW